MKPLTKNAKHLPAITERRNELARRVKAIRAMGRKNNDAAEYWAMMANDSAARYDYLIFMGGNSI